MRNLLICLALMALLGCTSGNTGIYEDPVFRPTLGAISIPAGPLTHNAVVDFTVDWQDGRAPFVVTWNFGFGGLPAIVSSGSFNNTHTATVAVLNDTGAPVTYDGIVLIEDEYGDTVSGSFTYTVQPAP